MDSAILVKHEFLVPIQGDASLSNGDRHPVKRWNLLSREMRRRFGAFTWAPGLYEGEYTDPVIGKQVRDQSRMCIIALPPEKSDELREMLSLAAAIFHQKCMYLSVGDKIEFIEAVKSDDSRLSGFGR